MKISLSWTNGYGRPMWFQATSCNKTHCRVSWSQLFGDAGKGVWTNEDTERHAASIRQIHGVKDESK